jgi:DNA-binding FadR family transcriptional regulator
MQSFGDLEQGLKPTRSRRASEDIALRLEAAMLDGRLTPGQRLPSEREMQTRFGTGRGAVREAIKLLQQKGLLEVRQGVKGGAYVRQVQLANVSESLSLFLNQHPVAPETLIEFRESVDQTITQLAIARATATDKDRLLEEAKRFEALLRAPDPDLEAVGELDRQLNLRLARMAGNALFEWVMHALQMGFSSYDDRLYENAAFREQAAANWRDTAQAIADHEPLRALSYVGRHYSLLRECVADRALGEGISKESRGPQAACGTEGERS